MYVYLVRRLISTLPVMVIVGMFVFSLLYLAPGDPAALVAGDLATAADIAKIRDKLGLNEPFLVRFVHWSWDLLHGETRWLEGQTAAVSAAVAVGGGITSEEEEEQLDALNDWMDIWGDLGPADRLRAELSVSRGLDALQAAGFVVHVGTRDQVLEGGIGPPSRWSTAVLVVHRSRDAQAQLKILLALAGKWNDDPDIEEIVREAYRRRGRPLTETCP